MTNNTLRWMLAFVALPVCPFWFCTHSHWDTYVLLDTEGTNKVKYIQQVGSHHEATRNEEEADNFCTAPHPKIQLNFVKHFRIFIVLFLKFHLFVAKFSQISPILTKIFRKFSKFAGKYQNLLESQISWDFAPKIVEIFREWLSKS